MKALFLALALTLSVPAYATIEVPALTGPVIDQAGILSPSESAELAAELQAFRQKHGPQIQILIVPTLNNEPIESFSIRVVDGWKLGDKQRDDGALLLIAAQDRKLRIEVGQGLEAKLPDIIAGRIINQVIVPYFKAHRYSDGVRAGIKAIEGRIQGNQGEEFIFGWPQDRPRKHPWIFLLAILFPLLFIIWIASRFSPPQGHAYRGNNWSNWSSGGFSGGGDWSGGGGGFSGGGSSGSW